MATAADDQAYMTQAIALSLTHLGQTGTNPSVGCLIVSDGEIVGRGVTAIGGRPHAEQQAVAQAGNRAVGATAYVTLEPCAHHGRTPPCANALVAAGIARTVVAVADPDIRVSGRGLQILRDAGIQVETGVLAADARRALAFYLTRQTKNRPYVILKLAVSADGMLGRTGEGQMAITGPEARARVQRLRAESDAILIGIGTALADDPLLTVRTPDEADRSPIRIVLDTHLRLPLTAKLVQTAGQVPLIVVADGLTEERAHAASMSNAIGEITARRDALTAAGAEVLEDGHLDTLLFGLATRGISSLLVEGGANVAQSFLDAGLVDRIMLFEGGDTIGANGVVAPVTPDMIPQGFAHVHSEMFGTDRLDEYDRVETAAIV